MSSTPWRDRPCSACTPYRPELLIIWLAHIGMDRALGNGLKYPWAFRDTHLGRIGRD
ncbi:MAG: DUF4260 family protein [Acidimicrobiia bacterium]